MQKQSNCKNVTFRKSITGFRPIHAVRQIIPKIGKSLWMKILLFVQYFEI